MKLQKKLRKYLKMFQSLKKRPKRHQRNNIKNDSRMKGREVCIGDLGGHVVAEATEVTEAVYTKPMISNQERQERVQRKVLNKLKVILKTPTTEEVTTTPITEAEVITSGEAVEMVNGGDVVTANLEIAVIESTEVADKMSGEDADKMSGEAVEATGKSMARLTISKQSKTLLSASEATAGALVATVAEEATEEVTPLSIKVT